MGDERVERQDEVQGAGPEDAAGTEPEDEVGTPEAGAPGSPDSGSPESPEPSTSSEPSEPSASSEKPDSGSASSSGSGEPSGSAESPEFGPIPELDLDEEPVDLRQRVASVLPRVGAMVAFGCAGFLGITSFVTAQGTDLRAERQSDLGDLVQAQSQRVNELSHQVAELDQEVAELSQQVGGVEVERFEEATDRLKPEVGLTPVRGPGVTVTLDDAPREMRDGQPNLDALVVHQQDIQAVVNALWAGGAEAVTIQGQRLISTSAIRCVGNSVVLHRVPYPPPYRISAVGDVESMVDAMYASDEVRAYLDAVDRFQLGFDLQRHPEIRLPGFQGSFELSHAKVIGAAGRNRTFGEGN